jgi:hypothetical protein
VRERVVREREREREREIEGDATMRPQDMNFAAKQILKESSQKSDLEKERERKKEPRERIFFLRAQTEVSL